MIPIDPTFSATPHSSSPPYRLAHPNPYLVAGHPRAAKPLFQTFESPQSGFPQWLKMSGKGVSSLALTVSVGSWLINAADVQSSVTYEELDNSAQLPSLEDFQPEFPGLEIDPVLTPDTRSTETTRLQSPPSQPTGLVRPNQSPAPRLTPRATQQRTASVAVKQKLAVLPPPTTTPPAYSDHGPASSVAPTPAPAPTVTVAPSAPPSPVLRSAPASAPHIASAERGTLTPPAPQTQALHRDAIAPSPLPQAQPLDLEAAPPSPPLAMAKVSPSTSGSPAFSSVSPSGSHVTAGKGRALTLPLLPTSEAEAVLTDSHQDSTQSSQPTHLSRTPG